MRIRAFIATAALLPMFLGACGSDKSSDTTAEVTEAPATEAGAQTEAVSSDTEAVETESVETEAVETESIETEAADTVATDTTASTESATGSPSSTDDVILKQMLMGMNGGKEPSADEVACMAKAFPSDKLAKFVEAASASGTPSSDVLAPLMTAMFTCKPAGLAESLAASLNDDGSLDGLSASETTCLADGILDLMANEPSLMEEFLNNGSSSTLSADAKAALTKKATPTVEKCVKDGALRAKVLANMTK